MWPFTASHPGFLSPSTVSPDDRKEMRFFPHITANGERMIEELRSIQEPRFTLKKTQVVPKNTNLDASSDEVVSTYTYNLIPFTLPTCIIARFVRDECHIDAAFTAATWGSFRDSKRIVGSTSG